MTVSIKLATAVMHCLSDFVSDDRTRETLQTALIDPEGKTLIATNGFSLIKIKISEGITTALLGDRVDPGSAVKLLKAGKYPERKSVDLAYPDVDCVIEVAEGLLSDSRKALPPRKQSPTFDANLLATAMAAIARVHKACRSVTATTTIRYGQDEGAPMRLDSECHDGEVTVTMTAVIMPVCS